MLELFNATRNDYSGGTWEQLCRNFVAAKNIDGVVYKMASRWWGNYYDEERKRYCQAELDVVAESFDGQHIFIGECKWKDEVNVREELLRLKTIAKGLSFAKGHTIHYGLFLKEPPTHSENVAVFYPDDVMTSL